MIMIAHKKNNATKTSSFIYVSAWQLLEWSRIPLYQRFVLIDRNLNPQKTKKAPQNGCFFNTPC
ncbi:hypothetical protein OFM35_25550, partial [Escherichia coli]|nr:hypothetical protein [Escherichia coli]